MQLLNDQQQNYYLFIYYEFIIVIPLKKGKCI